MYKNSESSVTFSTKSSTLFSTLSRQLEFTSDKNTLCPTHWTVRHTAIESILLNYHLESNKKKWRMVVMIYFVYTFEKETSGFSL